MVEGPREGVGRAGNRVDGSVREALDDCRDLRLVDLLGTRELNGFRVDPRVVRVSERHVGPARRGDEDHLVASLVDREAVSHDGIEARSVFHDQGMKSSED